MDSGLKSSNERDQPLPLRTLALTALLPRLLIHQNNPIDGARLWHLHRWRPSHHVPQSEQKRQRRTTNMASRTARILLHLRTHRLGDELRKLTLFPLSVTDRSKPYLLRLYHTPQRPTTRTCKEKKTNDRIRQSLPKQGVGERKTRIKRSILHGSKPDRAAARDKVITLQMYSSRILKQT